jgi:hypothetical protein
MIGMSIREDLWSGETRGPSIDDPEHPPYGKQAEIAEWDRPNAPMIPSSNRF